MAIVNPVNYYATAGSDGASKGSKTQLGKDTFLQLLVTQMQNQNPLNPMDGTEFTSQLAQFSQLEKLDNMGTTLNYLQLYLSSLNNAQAVDFIGKEIEARGDSVQLSDGGSASLNYELKGDAGSVTIRIYDENKQLVRTVEAGSQNSGRHGWTWNGENSAGDRLAAGKYTFEVSATDAAGSAVEAATYLSGVVTNISFDGGVTYLELGDQKVTVGDVIKVGDKEVVAENAPQSTMAQTLDALEGIGKFMIQAAPLAMTLL
jgi:flagellar basal-body rod modification protein FlgD